MLTAIAGINWGDEGKGRMVDLLSADYNVVVRYQGGNNAGHTVINERGEFVLNLLPSGILREGVVNVMGTGMVVDLSHFKKEVTNLQQRGVSVTPENLKLSNRAVICMPYNVAQDGAEEDRLAGHKFGSTRRGIGPIYGDKYMKKALRIGDLLDKSTLADKVRAICEWKNLTLHSGYGLPAVDPDEMLAWLEEYGSFAQPYICDAAEWLYDAAAAGRNIMFEAQLGALRDIDLGIYPYTSSSPTIAAYAPIGAGIPGWRLDNVVGIMKAYSTCVGEGPFTCELFGEEAERLRQAGHEYGAATGRPRRVGPFDVVASRYGVHMQGAQELALTKLDVLTGMKLEATVAYDIDGQRVERFPYGDRLERAKPINVSLPGWDEDISSCRSEQELPQACRDYIDYLERSVGCGIRYVSVGPQREQYFLREPKLA